jgi:hypothetical protein
MTSCRFCHFSPPTVKADGLSAPSALQTENERTPFHFVLNDNSRWQYNCFMPGIAPAYVNGISQDVTPAVFDAGGEQR